MFRYTDEEREFFKQYVPGHSRKEIEEAFIERFKWEITLDQVTSYIKNNKLNTGRTGRFEKGHVPFNKGRGALCKPGTKRCWYKKGHIPQTHKPVGTESKRKDKKGKFYVYIKIAEPNVWEKKHILEWEKHNGAVPKGYMIIFVDGNRENCSIENLRMIDKKTNILLNRSGLCNARGEYKDVAINIAKLQLKAKERKG